MRREAQHSLGDGYFTDHLLAYELPRLLRKATKTLLSGLATEINLLNIFLKKMRLASSFKQTLKTVHTLKNFILPTPY